MDCVQEGIFIFMGDIDLLLDEEDYITALSFIEDYAQQFDLKYDGSSYSVMQIATTMLMATEMEPKLFVLLVKLIYNVGYRDNSFKSPNIH